MFTSDVVARRALTLGFLLWAVGTIGIRLAGNLLLHPASPGRTLALYAVSFATMAVLIPRICRGLGLDADAAFRGMALLMIPTLVLDPLSCLFFQTLFQGVNPGAVGVFGGWLLACCGGAAVGTLATR